MNSSLNDIRKFWEHCIYETMFLRGHCINRPSLYFTESGSLVLDARPVNPVDTTVVNAVAVICDLIAEECGYRQDTSVSVTGLSVWKEGGDV